MTLNTTPDQFLQTIRKKQSDTNFLLATIPADYTSGNPTVIFDGEATPTTRTFRCLAGYVPVAGDRVLILVNKNDMVIAGAIPNAPTGGTPAIEDTGWTIIENLQNSWVDYEPADATWKRPRYRKINKTVTCTGLIMNGITTPDTVIFTLPDGFRPWNRKMAICTCYGTEISYARVDVRTNGDVTFQRAHTGGGNAWLSLDTIRFEID